MGKRWKRRWDHKSSESRVRETFPKNHSTEPIVMFQIGIDLSQNESVCSYGLRNI